MKNMDLFLSLLFATMLSDNYYKIQKIKKYFFVIEKIPNPFTAFLVW
jgi:hypothetical protein